LRRVAFARIADDKKAEITRAFYAAGMDSKQIVGIAAIGAADRVDNADAPVIYPRFRQLLINPGRPAFRIEIPSESPGRIEGYKKSGDWQTEAQDKHESRPEGVARRAQSQTEVEAAFEPAANQPVRRGIRRRSSWLGVEAKRPRQTLDRPCQPLPEEVCRKHEKHPQNCGHKNIASGRDEG